MIGFILANWRIAAIGLLIASLSAYVLTLRIQRDSARNQVNQIKLDWEQANRTQREKEANQANTAATKLEETRAKDRVIVKNVVQEVERIVDRVEYRTVCFNPHFLCIANAGIGGSDASSCRITNPLPTSWEARGRDGGHDIEMDRGSLGGVSRLSGEASGS